jgi:hypothetical protein
MRRCSARNAAGEACRAAPLRDGPLCRMHAPEHAEAVAEGRRRGGARRRGEVAVALSYDLAGINIPADVIRLLEIAALDTLVLPNSAARSRALAQVASATTRAMAVNALDERVTELERLLGHRDER